VSDIINLLSDHIANQIAAGEVVQRPSSLVKELMENALDAEASEIQLIIKDAGKELVQVVDNGIGMSPTDARMSFERHATSKIKNIQDLFTIRTMGFRGEALASIAAVAQVELKTKRAQDEMGTKIIIEGTQVITQEPVVVNKGTSVSVKNLFFNVPARRHFLKSTTTELKHNLDEFIRIALAYPAIQFKFWNNHVEQFNLTAGTLKHRIVSLLGNHLEKNLVPVEEETEVLKIRGFIGKPQSATKTRGNQFFFINNRFIKNAYLHHAVMQAYESLIEKESFPFYVLFLEIDPTRVDVNVHPTKQEVKFEDDRLMYAYLQAAIKHALARFNIAPSLDFSLNADIQHLPSLQNTSSQSSSPSGTSYLQQAFQQKNQTYFIDKKDGLEKWKELYAINAPTASLPSVQAPELSLDNEATTTSNAVLMVQGAYLVSTVKSGLILIHIKRAQERIWYERLKTDYERDQLVSQQLLFPTSYSVAPSDAILLQEIIPDLRRIGFDIMANSAQEFIIKGTPSALQQGEETKILEALLEQLKHAAEDIHSSRVERLMVQMAKQFSRNSMPLHHQEAQQLLIDELFACQQPSVTAEGQLIFNLINKDALDALLENK
jgi:DNA mismatch repair protein MutL